ncbi:glycosyltransferase [Sphaerochaeta pleomorpha str. Grapes]|uniref:Glycosyltransferase n=1 Tax=Sphaerochaeta pleomorpha (strain ATCC BAA-1885 / DSM 22778 / Grapes) TaxID=158190 RepID=G8QYM5_SPHPG|nr:glycosyltransferase [Sphaerochaeta pleomorpha]AEV28588.1 glycosyltransferase [Sphaerochaeta pleomorpha str. Grapes]
MSKRQKLHIYFILVTIFLSILIGYRIYLSIYEKDYQSLNAVNIETIETKLIGQTTFSFAVVGNIDNSMRIFSDRIVPLMQDENVDFLISVGNAVFDGAEGKYRLLHRGLTKLDIPYILVPGNNEVADFGSNNFYQHFGPYFYSYHLDNAYFIFLDSTGITSWKWQLHWLNQELETAKNYPYRFVFLGHSLLPQEKVASENSSKYTVDAKTSKTLQQLFSQYEVTSVFSTGYHTNSQQSVGGVRYVVSSGGGGLLLDNEQPYQFVKVMVNPQGFSCTNITAPNRFSPIREKVETLKLYLHSLFYMSIFNILVIIGIFTLFSLLFYSKVLKQQHLYRDFNIDEEASFGTPLRIAMFTNNYLPFIGGVPLSIDRLHKGLLARGNTVLIFAPSYLQNWDDPSDGSVYRCPVLFYTKRGEFPAVNIFNREIGKVFRKFKADIIHVHHPFMLGWTALLYAKRAKLPVVMTYHTRLERYTQYLFGPGMMVKNFLIHLMIKHFANRCDAIIAPSSSTEEYLRNLGVSAIIETIPTGINIEAYGQWTAEQIEQTRAAYVRPGENLLISVSRIAEEKNLDFLVVALEKLKATSSKKFTCILIGDGPERKRLEAKVKAMGMQDTILFLGKLAPSEVVRCYLAADLFVFASTSETQGMVLLEAMAGGCPVVAIRSSGVYDVVHDGVNGFKVPESTNIWAETVKKILEDAELLSEMSGNSREFAKQYSVESITERVLALYRRVILLNASKRSES